MLAGIVRNCLPSGLASELRVWSMLVSARARSSAARAVRRALPLRAFSSQAAEPATDKLWIFDTTLRDGEQSPGATLS